MPIRARAIVQLAMILAVAASGLRLLDGVPRLLTGLPRGVVRVDSLDALQARIGGPVAMPLYFPGDLRWPPDDITVFAGRETAVTVRHRDSGEPWLTIAGAPAAADRISPSMLSPVALLQDSDTTVAGVPAHVQRVQDASGAIWHQAIWRRDGRLILVRYRGPVDDLLRIAASLRSRSRP